MGSVTVLEKPTRACCATCSNWGLAAYYVHPSSIDGDEPFCTVLNISLKPYFGPMSTHVTCKHWRLEMIETDSRELFEQLCMEGA